MAAVKSIPRSTSTRASPVPKDLWMEEQETAGGGEDGKEECGTSNVEWGSGSLGEFMMRGERGMEEWEKSNFELGLIGGGSTNED
jgi:hypothetical protein